METVDSRPSTAGARRNTETAGCCSTRHAPSSAPNLLGTSGRIGVIGSPACPLAQDDPVSTTIRYTAQHQPTHRSEKVRRDPAGLSTGLDRHHRNSLTGRPRVPDSGFVRGSWIPVPPPWRRSQSGGDGAGSLTFWPC